MRGSGRVIRGTEEVGGVTTVGICYHGRRKRYEGYWVDDEKSGYGMA